MTLSPACRAARGKGVGRQDRVIGGRVVDRRDDLRQQPPEIRLVEHDLDMLGPDRLRGGARSGALVGHLACRETDREGLDRPLGQPRHHDQHGRRIDAAREKHPERDVRALVEAHAFSQRRIQPRQCLLLVDRQGAAFGQRLAPAALDDAPLAYHHGLARAEPDLSRRRSSRGRS